MSAIRSASSIAVIGDVARGAGALVDVVGEAAGRGDEQVDAALQLAGLAVERHAAHDGGGGQARAPWRTARARRRPAVASSRVGTRTRPRGRPGLRPVAGEPGQHREPERQRLAGAGLAAAEQVAAGERVGQRRGLDGERLGEAVGGERLRRAGPAGRARRTWACPTSGAVQRTSGAACGEGGGSGRCAGTGRGGGAGRRAGTAMSAENWARRTDGDDKQTSGTWHVSRRTAPRWRRDPRTSPGASCAPW